MSEESRHIVAILQARTGSTRLPGKVLFDLAGEPLLARVISRLKTAERPDRLVVATTETDADAAVEWFAHRQGVGTYRGSETDVLSRYYEAAKAFDADVIVRLTTDNPFLAPEVVDEVIRTRFRTGAEYCSTEFEDTLPEGIGAEAFTMESFRTVHEKSTDSVEREHVTPYFRSHENEFEVASVTSADVYEQPELLNRTDLRLTMDTPKDYQYLTTLLEELDADVNVPLGQVIQHLDEHGSE
jgi:spore coat polysaccharide biosynthesis protein SpsF